MGADDGQIIDIGPAVDADEERVVPFMGYETQAARLEGLGIYVTIKSLCAMIGIKYERQYERIRRTATLAKHTRLIRVQTKGGKQPMACLKVSRVAFWLATIQTTSVKDEQKRAILEGLQEDFADVANEIFMRRIGASAVSLTPLPTNQETASLVEQYDELLEVVNFMRDHILALSSTVAPLPEKLDYVAQLLERFFALQEQQQTQIARIDERTQGLSPVHARAVADQVDMMVRRTKHQPKPLEHRIIYWRLKQKFRAGSYKEIPDGKFNEVIIFLQEELRMALNDDTPTQTSLF